METIKTYTKEDLLLVIETMCEKHRIDENDLVNVIFDVKLEKFQKTKYYKPSTLLTRKLENGDKIETAELNENLKYLEKEISIEYFYEMPNFGEIAEFVSNNSLYNIEIDYDDCVDWAIEYKNYEAVKYFYYNLGVDFSKTLIWNKERIVLFNMFPELKPDLINYVKSRPWSSSNFIFAYYKIRPAEFTNELMQTILQNEYEKYRCIKKCKMRDLFIKLINPKGDCKICFANHCNCINVIPYEVEPICARGFKCDKCNDNHGDYRDKYCDICKKCACNEHKHCLTCMSIMDEFNNCTCI